MELRTNPKRSPASFDRVTRCRTEARAKTDENGEKPVPVSSKLAQWPCQLGLVHAFSPYLDGADVLLAADCTAYAYAAFHEDFMKNRITLVACPRLGTVDVYERLVAILSESRIASLTVVRMEVSCCSSLEDAARRAVRDSDSRAKLNVITVSTDGKILK